MNEEKEMLEPKYVIKPRFSFLYELIMPTGRKIKNSLLIFLGIIILYFVLMFCKDAIELEKMFNGFDINSVLNMIFLVLLIVVGVKAAIHIVFQILQYKYLSYSFFDDHMVYEDSFLNQHRKTIQYSNIKEVEIRRTIADRILGYGIIVIYTNAENSNNGLVIYSIKSPQECYDKIQSILKEAKDNKNDINTAKTENINVSTEDNKSEENKVQNIDNEEVKEISDIVDLTIEEEEKFNESLKNIND